MESKALHLISPNMHIIMVHFPLGIFIFGLFLEVFSFLWRRSSVRIAARWMILLGGLASVPAALSGMDAFHEVNDATIHQVVQEGVKLKIRGVTPQQWAFLQKHILLTSIGSGLAAVAVTIALGLSDLWRRRLYFPLLAVLIAAAVLLTYGSHFGGEGIYLEKLAVQLTGIPATGVEWWVPARATHVLVAGLAMGVALGALGATMRRLSTMQAVRDEMEAERELSALTSPAAPIDPAVPAAPTTEIEMAPVPTPAARRAGHDLLVARTLNADAAMAGPRVPASRFWLLSSVLFLAALGFGIWFLISLQDQTFDLQHVSASTISHEVWQTATKTSRFMLNRRGLHIFLGIALVVLPLLLAITARFMIRARMLIITLCALTVLAIAGEVWLGALLSYRGAEGPIYKFPSQQQDTGAGGDNQTAMVLPHVG